MTKDVRKLHALAKRAGVKLNFKLEPRSTIGYQNGVIAAKDVSFYDLCHEIAHYVLASPKRRLLPNFGLGTSPFDGSTMSTSPRAVSLQTASE